MDTAPQTARLVVRVLLVSCLIGGTLFGVSGRLDWAGAWFLLVVAASYSAATAVYFSRSDPDLLRERMSRPSNVPAWDRVIVWFYPLLIGSLFVTAALDARRRPGQSLPLAVQLLGGIGLIVTLAEGPTPSSLPDGRRVDRAPRLEDRVLQKDLAGYREFATRVRYRLIPRIW